MSQLADANKNEAQGMSFTKLIHAMGLVCVFAGALIALAEILHPAGEDLIAVHSALWSPAHMTWWLGVLLLQFGLIAPSSPQIANELLVGPLFWVLLNEASFGGGIVLFAVATMRARVYPRWAGLLVIIGIALYLASWVPPDRVLSHAIALASNLTFGLGVAWMGYALWSEKQ